MFPDYPTDFLAEICQVLKWVDSHPGAEWEDMGPLLDVYYRWRDVINKEQLFDRLGTMYTVPGLSGFGRIFLSKHCSQKPGQSKPQPDQGGKTTKAKSKRGGGRQPLEKQNPLKFQVYKRIHREHQPSEEYQDTLDRLKNDKDFVQQVADAKLKLNSKLVRNALAFFDQRNRNARKEQETGSP
jgi:hypothetical protein